MSLIEQDWGRYRQIIRGEVRPDLNKYLTHPDLFVNPSGTGVKTLPVPRIDSPHFRFERGREGVGQGDDNGKAGDQPGKFMYDAEISIEELTE